MNARSPGSSGLGESASAPSAHVEKRPDRERRLLDLHRALVATPSVSGDEGRIATFLEAIVRARGAETRRVGRNLIARAGRGPRILFNSHVDTVPPADGWSRDPWSADVEDGRVIGLGSNDAKASVAAMVSAFLDVAESDGPCEVLLLLAVDEETGGEGTEFAWPILRDEGFLPAGVVVGEPTGLEIVTAQRGLLVLELLAEGDACHSAHASSLGARNPIRGLARDLVALESVDLGEAHPVLGRTTLEPTVLRAGERRNMVPGVASAVLDLRTVPGVSHADLVSRLGALIEGRVRVRSDRLKPVACPADALVVAAARAARPVAPVVGSSTMSDLVFFQGVPGIKCGPGDSKRSHRPDEYVLESEVVEGARFYTDLLDAFARRSS